MKFTRHEHCIGTVKIPQAQCDEVEAALTKCAIKPALRAAPLIRNKVIESLVHSGWSGEVSVALGSQITITSSRNNIGLCLQTGNMSRLYADMMKLQKLFLDNSIKAGIMIVPMPDAARALGDNIASYSRLTKELDIFRKVIHMPMLVYGFE
ncbi:BglII/BstYI family type II restriction endonuclease [Xanthomonas translucens]|uniref:BglII/BstYI family type II restriction endonuclease n=1 Tax=Xanthomonas campestris pv. translucens TaxID=343 RepID=UPI0009C09B34|nr:BglII/BstYI family type II restriction endonuclease [Xanthomonas translucens]QEN94996.1 hypothetical protein F0H33_17975 [Xanthomonas translucens pv. undulosa]QSQ31170.1 hypothetical protein ISN30_04705 [Xanthomonas translucens pv. translucens]